MPCPCAHVAKGHIRILEPKLKVFVLSDHCSEVNVYAACDNVDAVSSSGDSFFAWQRRARNKWLVMNRKGPGDGCRRQAKHVWPAVSFPPSFARTISSKERRLGTRQMLTGYNNRPYLKGGHVFPFPSAKVKGQINVHFSLRSQQQRVWWIHHESTVNQEKALCLHCQLVSCFSDFFGLCGKSLLSCESISS